VPASDRKTAVPAAASKFLSRYGEWVGMASILVGVLLGQVWSPAYGLGLAIYGLIGAVYGEILVKWKVEVKSKKLLGRFALAIGAVWFLVSLLRADQAS
jgi:hypothetical protein